MNIPFRQLYLLQLENYDLGRFLALVPRSYALSRPRQNLVWTPKLIAVEALSVLLGAAAVLVSAFFLPPPIAVLFAVVAFFFFHFVFLVVAVVAFSPFDAMAKRHIVEAAREALAKHPDLCIVAVAGSYGKTTMKEALAAALSEQFTVLATGGNLNTPLGISRTVLSGLTPDTETFVVEMGEHEPGDLAYLTKLAPPDVVVLTGIAEAHLERFRTFDKLIAGIFEAVDGLKPGGLALLNADDPRIVENYRHHLDGRQIAFFSSRNAPSSAYAVGDETFREDGSGVSFSLRKGAEDLGTFSLPLLGGYAPGVAVAACIVGEKLGMDAEEVKRGLAKMKQVPHRLEVVPSGNDVLVIDDSYNGNPAGAHYAIEVLARFANRRKIYVTPGLVEAGARSADVHREIGRELAKVADLVVLIRNSATPFIAEGLEKGGFPKDRIRWFGSALEAHRGVPGIIARGDVILFQNDWPDNYT